MTTEQPARIVVLGRIPDVGLSRLREAGQVWAWDRDEPIPGEVRDEQLATADAAVTLLTNVVDAGFLSAAPRLKVVANVAVGFNNIDVAAAPSGGCWSRTRPACSPTRRPTWPWPSSSWSPGASGKASG